MRDQLDRDLTRSFGIETVRLEKISHNIREFFHQFLKGSTFGIQSMQIAVLDEPHARLRVIGGLDDNQASDHGGFLGSMARFASGYIIVGEQIGADPVSNESKTSGLETIAGAVKQAGKGPPPVHLWNPPFCGDLDMRIAADGTWFYLKTPIGRHALVKLFSSVLKREGEKYFLVTPVEKVGITVDDAPFTAVEMKVEGEGASRVLSFRTNADDWVACGPGHALRFEPEPETGGLKPYLHVRRELWALVTRALFYDLVELGEERDVDGQRMFGVASGGEFYVMAPAATLVIPGPMKPRTGNRTLWIHGSRIAACGGFRDDSGAR
jgi:uncharacterized protein